MIERTVSIVVCAVALTGTVVSAQTQNTAAGVDFKFDYVGALIAADLAPSYASRYDLATFGQDDESPDGDGLPSASDTTGELGGAEYAAGEWTIWAGPYIWLPAFKGDMIAEFKKKYDLK